MQGTIIERYTSQILAGVWTFEFSKTTSQIFMTDHFIYFNFVKQNYSSWNAQSHIFKAPKPDCQADNDDGPWKYCIKFEWPTVIDVLN